MFTRGKNLNSNLSQFGTANSVTFAFVRTAALFRHSIQSNFLMSSSKMQPPAMAGVSSHHRQFTAFTALFSKAKATSVPDLSRMEISTSNIPASRSWTGPQAPPFGPAGEALFGSNRPISRKREANP
jgi:hypothetical protein